MPSCGCPAVVVNITSEGSLMQQAHIAPLSSQMTPEYTAKRLTPTTASQEVRVLDNTGLVGAWGSADTLSMAASCGSLIAAARGTSVTVINVDAGSGEPSATKTLHFSEQVSAVALLKMPHAVAAVSGMHDYTEVQSEHFTHGLQVSKQTPASFQRRYTKVCNWMETCATDLAEA